MTDEEKVGVPVGIDLLVVPEDKIVVMRVKLSEVPKEGDTVSLAMPVDSALTMALSLISCVKELRDNDAEVNALFPPIDPGKGN